MSIVVARFSLLSIMFIVATHFSLQSVMLITFYDEN